MPDNETSSSQSKGFVVAYPGIEALVKSMNLPPNSPAWAEFAGNCGYNHRRPQLQYPLRTFFCMVEFYRQHFYPDMPQEQAYYEIARRQGKAYVEDTILGRVGYAARGHMAHPKYLEVFLRNHNLVCLFGTRTIEHLEPGHSRMSFRDDPSNPSFIRGTLYAALGANGATDIRIEAQPIAHHHFDYDIYWREGDSVS